MRKTLHAMLGLVALGLWATPTLAAVSTGPQKAPPKLSEAIPMENRAGIGQRSGGNYQGTLSGTLIKQAQATTSWFLYPGACNDRYNAPGPWAPKSNPVADSLDSYTTGTTGPYTTLDQSLSEFLWHVSDDATCTTGTTCPPALHDDLAQAGARMLWCGKFDANWVVKYGYPNLTYQILYFDTGAHGADYTLRFTYNFSTEQNYDYVYLIGGGDGLTDPIGNSRATLDQVIATAGGVGNKKLLVRWTGSISGGNANASGGSTTGGTLLVPGAGSGQPSTVTAATYTIAAQHRALYFVFQSDCLFSSEDGLWPEGHGQQIDRVDVNGTAGSLYSDEAGVNVADTTVPVGGGIVLKGTAGAPIISARVPPGVGELWQLVTGNNLPTPDVCTPKSSTTDKIFMGGNSATHHTIPNQFNSVLTCTFPVPTGVASVLALWDEYLDLPRFQGYVQYSEFRIFKDGSWGNWANTSPGGGVLTGARQSWGLDGDELGAATQADSVQIRYNIQCINFFAADHQNCGDVAYGVLYDNFRLELVTGVPAPIFGVFVGSVAQSMFVDGTISSPGNCNAGTVTNGRCWPGVRGSDIGTAAAVHDNFNSPLGDSITLSLVTGLRKNGKGINWHHGFDKSFNAGLSIAYTNPNFLAAVDKPRVIYRIFDPASRAWSPWDSSELDANAVSVQAGDTILIDSEYRMNWPPRDKAGTSLPAASGTWPGSVTNTLGAQSLYDNLPFLPRGARLQYYFKATDVGGGSSVQFSSDALAREVDDIPLLPCQTGDAGCVSGGAQNGNHNSIKAPDIIEFDVLPRVYATTGVTGQLAGVSNTPVLDLDGSYTRWNFGSHATVQILRAMGVRADRYRTLQGLEEGGHIGGHEFAGTRAGRLSNYFPNMDEYAIKALLASSYRIMIESSHTATSVVDEETDSKLIKDWWEEPTGTDGGDRCVFASGDDYFSALLAVGGVPHPNENDLATLVFGVQTAANQWNGGTSVQFPAINDRFSDPAAGPALGAVNAYKYIVDGGCPAPNRFDALTRAGGSENVDVATYPLFAGVTNVAAVSRMFEKDVPTDHDRNKALGYGFSIQFIRQGGTNLVDTRAQVLYKFLTSCRGPRSASDTASCWPCPTAANKYADWSTLASSFQTSTYGPLYNMQAFNTILSGVGDPIAGAPAVNAIKGNFPNPFNPETAIRFTSAMSGRVEVRIFDVAGRLVQTLAKNVTSGVNEVRWNGKASDGSNVASGVYFVGVKYPDGYESPRALKVAVVR